MWVDAGFPPDSFWIQTPLHFQMAMRGWRERHKRSTEADLWRAYTHASLNAAASAGKLKAFAHYKRALSPAKAALQTPAEMLDALRQFQAGGAPMTIRRIERKPD